jgi:hypothetical protein
MQIVARSELAVAALRVGELMAELPGTTLTEKYAGATAMIADRDADPATRTRTAQILEAVQAAAGTHPLT